MKRTTAHNRHAPAGSDRKKGGGSEVGPVAMKAVRQMRRQVLSGRLTEGMLLPSVRALASDGRIGLVTAYKALQRAEEEGWVVREGGRRLRVARQAARRARSFFEQEPPSLVYWVLSVERRLQAEFRLPGLSEGMQEGLPFSSSRYLFLDADESAGHLEQVLAELKHNAEIGYVLLSLPNRLQRVFQRLDMPCVVLGNAEPELNLPSVYVDQRKAGLIAGGLLCRSGRVVTLCGEQLVGGEANLIAGVSDAARLLGRPIPMQDEFYWKLPNDPDGILRRIDELLAMKDRPGGILATRAEFAVATLSVAARRGLRIPRDLQLVGQSHHPMFEYCHPRITSLGISSDQEMGRRCAELLTDAFLRRADGAATVEIEPTVMERESSLPRGR